jgi:hypothetical protein
MAKNLASIVKNVSAGGVASTIDQEQKKVHVWENVGEHGIMQGVHGQGEHSCAYCRSCYIYCVPSVARPGSGTCDRNSAPNRVKFEIWGAGGYGAQPHNCGIAVPSGAGAYAYKTICNSDVVANNCYLIRIGYTWCCRPNASSGTNVTPSTEYRELDCTTHITGNGLTNFCAEPGRGTTIRCCNFNATCFDSDNARIWTLDSHDQGGLGPQAAYYGADGGAKGKLGYITKKQGAPADNPFSYMQHVPYAGGKIDKCGGHFIYSNVRYGHAGDLDRGMNYTQQWSCFDGLYHGVASHSPSYYVAGQGWPGAHTCGGASPCSGNTPGRVKISAWYEEE